MPRFHVLSLFCLLAAGGLFASLPDTGGAKTAPRCLAPAMEGTAAVALLGGEQNPTRRCLQILDRYNRENPRGLSEKGLALLSRLREGGTAGETEIRGLTCARTFDVSFFRDPFAGLTDDELVHFLFSETCNGHGSLNAVRGCLNSCTFCAYTTSSQKVRSRPFPEVAWILQHYQRLAKRYMLPTLYAPYMDSDPVGYYDAVFDFYADDVWDMAYHKGMSLFLSTHGWSPAHPRAARFRQAVKNIGREMREAAQLSFHVSDMGPWRRIQRWVDGLPEDEAARAQAVEALTRTPEWARMEASYLQRFCEVSAALLDDRFPDVRADDEERIRLPFSPGPLAPEKPRRQTVFLNSTAPDGTQFLQVVNLCLLRLPGLEPGEIVFCPGADNTFSYALLGPGVTREGFAAALSRTVCQIFGRETAGCENLTELVVNDTVTPQAAQAAFPGDPAAARNRYLRQLMGARVLARYLERFSSAVDGTEGKTFSLDPRILPDFERANYNIGRGYLTRSNDVDTVYRISNHAFDAFIDQDFRAPWLRDGRTPVSAHYYGSQFVPLKTLCAGPDDPCFAAWMELLLLSLAEHGTQLDARNISVPASRLDGSLLQARLRRDGVQTDGAVSLNYDHSAMGHTYHYLLYRLVAPLLPGWERAVDWAAFDAAMGDRAEGLRLHLTRNGFVDGAGRLTDDGLLFALNQSDPQWNLGIDIEEKTRALLLRSAAAPLRETIARFQREAGYRERFLRDAYARLAEFPAYHTGPMWTGLHLADGKPWWFARAARPSMDDLTQVRFVTFWLSPTHPDDGDKSQSVDMAA